MNARLNSLTNKHLDSSPKASTKRPKVNYRKACTEGDPFHDPLLLDSVGKDQHEDIRAAVYKRR